MEDLIRETVERRTPEARTQLLVQLLTQIHAENCSDYDEVLRPAGLERQQLAEFGFVDRDKFDTMYRTAAIAEGWRLNIKSYHITATPRKISDDQPSPFVTDSDVLTHLIRQSRAGSVMHLLALYLTGQHETTDAEIIWPKELKEQEAMAKLAPADENAEGRDEVADDDDDDDD